MDSIIRTFENDDNVRILPKVETFWDQCPESIKTGNLAFMKSIQSMLSKNEVLLVLDWVEDGLNRLSIIYVVVDKIREQDDKFRFMMSFHAPAFKFYDANSTFRRCVVRDKKWQDLAEQLIGFRHGLDA